MANFIEERQRDSPPSHPSDPEACINPVDLEDALSDGAHTPSSSRSSSSEDGMMDNLRWDEDVIITPTQNLDSYQWNAPAIAPTERLALAIPQERTPLIRKANSLSIPRTKKGYGSIEDKKRSKIRTKPPPRVRPLEPTQKAQETAPVTQRPAGRSTFGQTVSFELHFTSYL
jgi:hypothetical protein